MTWNIMDSGRPNTDLFGWLRVVSVHCATSRPSYLGHRVPELDILETPYLFSDLEQAHRALDGALGAVLIEATGSAPDSNCSVSGITDSDTSPTGCGLCANLLTPGG